MDKNTKNPPSGGKKRGVAKFFAIGLIALTLFTPLLSHLGTANAATTNGWQVKSIDTQIISKCWNNVPQSSIDTQVSMLKSLGVNYIAIGTPYDRPDEMAKWVTSIHNAGLNVWFRSHWLNWEGDEGTPKNMSPDTYLAKTKQFILDHPTFFKSGDSFTMNVEPENAGVANGGPFADWTSYRSFLGNEIDMSNAAFAQIGVSNVKTNWLSMNGWIADNALDQNIVNKMGMVTVDHYSPQGDPSNLTPIAQLASDMSSQLDEFHSRWNVPIMIGEWGYNINGDVSDDLQKTAVDAVYKVFASKTYIYGVSYWDHMGNQTRIINDNSGTPTTFRPAADVIKSYFTGSTTPTPTPTPTPDPTPPTGDPSGPTPPPAGGSNKIIADFENGLSGFDSGKVVAGDNSTGALQISNPANGSNGARKFVGGISLAGYTNVEMDINLHGKKLMSGDASALYFDQGGWKWVSLYKYVNNGLDGWQHISIPFSDFAGLNKSGDAAYLGYRFWNTVNGNYDLDNIALTGGIAPAPAPAPAPTPTPTPTPTPVPTPTPIPTSSSLIADFENGLNGFDGGKIVTGNNSVGALEITNPANGSNGAKKMLGGSKAGDNNYLEFDVNLNGNKILPGDASQIYFDQGGLRWVSLSKYAVNSDNGWQHIRIPLSDFAGLNANQGLASIGFRFWNNASGKYDIDNLVFTKS